MERNRLYPTQMHNEMIKNAKDLNKIKERMKVNSLREKKEGNLKIREFKRTKDTFILFRRLIR